MEQSLIKKIIEAALFAAGQPLSRQQLSALFGEEESPGIEAIGKAIESLREDYAERGIELVEVASGYRFQTCHEVHGWVARLWAERPAKYSRALLETLALIAYRQPITRGEIEQIRGVAVSTHIIRTLEEREWIRVVGHRDVPGKPALFGTSHLFLDYFGLKSLDQLPALSELRDFEDIDPQLDLPEAFKQHLAKADSGVAESSDPENQDPTELTEQDVSTDALPQPPQENEATMSESSTSQSDATQGSTP